MIEACVKLQGYNAESKAALPSRSLPSTSTSQGQRLKPPPVHLSRRSAGEVGQSGNPEAAQKSRMEKGGRAPFGGRFKIKSLWNQTTDP